MIVHSDADLDLAAQRIAFGGYYQAGQSCISVQRVLVRARSTTTSRRCLTKQVEQLKTGDPMDPTVDVGPVITRSEVDRIAEWVDEAVSQGAEVLTGGTVGRTVLLADAARADHAGDEGALRGGLRTGLPRSRRTRRSKRRSPR